MLGKERVGGVERLVVVLSRVFLETLARALTNFLISRPLLYVWALWSWKIVIEDMGRAGSSNIVLRIDSSTGLHRVSLIMGPSAPRVTVFRDAAFLARSTVASLTIS